MKATIALPLVAALVAAGPVLAEPAYVQSQWVTPGLPVVVAPVMTPIAPPMFAPVAGTVVATPILTGPPETVMPLVSPPAPAPPPATAAFERSSQPAMAAVAARGIYTVKKGAHLAVVARRTGSPLAAVIALNPTLDPRRLLPAGTRVVVPVPGSR